jgi:hypothetical protein
VPALRIFASLAAAALSGCVVINGKEISISDHEAVVPATRLSVDIARARVDAPSIPHRGHGIEAGLSGTSGSDTQTLATGDPTLVLNGTTFAAPAELRHEFDWAFGEFAYRFRHFFRGGTFGIETLAGVARGRMNLTTSSATQRARTSIDEYGPAGSFGIVWKFRPTTSLQSRYAAFIGSDTESDMAVQRLDLYVAQAIGRHAALRAGWSNWRVDISRFIFNGADEADMRVRFSGLALGLDLMF